MVVDHSAVSRVVKLSKKLYASALPRPPTEAPGYPGEPGGKYENVKGPICWMFSGKIGEIKAPSGRGSPGCQAEGNSVPGVIIIHSNKSRDAGGEKGTHKNTPSGQGSPKIHPGGKMVSVGIKAPSGGGSPGCQPGGKSGPEKKNGSRKIPGSFDVISDGKRRCKRRKKRARFAHAGND
jgi:hypothetical protein